MRQGVDQKADQTAKGLSQTRQVNPTEIRSASEYRDSSSTLMNDNRMADAASFTDGEDFQQEAQVDRTIPFQAYIEDDSPAREEANRCIAPERGHATFVSRRAAHLGLSVIIMPRLHFDEYSNEHAARPFTAKVTRKESNPAQPRTQINVSRRFGKLVGYSRSDGVRRRE